MKYMLRGAERIWPPRNEAQRSGAKWRGRGLGQRNMGFEKNLRYKLQENMSILYLLHSGGAKSVCFACQS